MKSELIVDVQPKEVSIALLEDSRLVSLQKEARDMAYAVGDIYLAKVKKLMPGLNAAFVNVGYEKDAFLHYLDLGSQFSSYEAYLNQLLGGDRKEVPSLENMAMLPPIDKHGSIADTVKPGQELLVQIVKEPISSKGPRLTTEITFTGRFMVLIPFGDKISISQKIKSQEEKTRLRKLLESIKPRNFSVIVRTSAEGKRVAELINELKSLVNSWSETVARAQKATAPSLIYQEDSRIVGMLRDVFSPSFESIHVNDTDVHGQIDRYVKLIAPEAKDIVKLYDKDIPIFDHFGITRQIKSSFGKTVSFRSGAYIIIESTEALHVVDVNSGNRTKGTNDQETNALEVNLRAADEIARQLRLRDMGGIIVVDFIDMAKGEHRQQLFEHMREIMANDRARHNILPLSKFGLMQITRQRVRPALSITTVENCPSCFGKGEVQPSLLFTDTLYEKLDYMVNTLAMRGFTMYVHPFVDAYIKRGIFTSLYGKWRRKFGRVFRILPDESLAYLQYRVFDSNRNEVDIKEEKDMNASSATKTANKARNRGEAPDELSDLELAESAVPAKPEPAMVDTAENETAAKKKKRRRKKSDQRSRETVTEVAEGSMDAVGQSEDAGDDVAEAIVTPVAETGFSAHDLPAETTAEPTRAAKKKAGKSLKGRSKVRNEVAAVPDAGNAPLPSEEPDVTAESRDSESTASQPAAKEETAVREEVSPKRKSRRKPASKKTAPAVDVADSPAPETPATAAESVDTPVSESPVSDDVTDSAPGKNAKTPKPAGKSPRRSPTRKVKAEKAAVTSATDNVHPDSPATAPETPQATSMLPSLPLPRSENQE